MYRCIVLFLLTYIPYGLLYMACRLLYRSVRFKGVRIFNIFGDGFSTDCSISEYKNNIKSFLLLNEISVNT